MSYKIQKTGAALLLIAGATAVHSWMRGPAPVAATPAAPIAARLVVRLPESTPTSNLIARASSGEDRVFEVPPQRGLFVRAEQKLQARRSVLRSTRPVAAALLAAPHRNVLLVRPQHLEQPTEKLVFSGVQSIGPAAPNPRSLIARATSRLIEQARPALRRSVLAANVAQPPPHTRYLVAQSARSLVEATRSALRRSVLAQNIIPPAPPLRGFTTTARVRPPEVATFSFSGVQSVGPAEPVNRGLVARAEPLTSSADSWLKSSTTIIDALSAEVPTLRANIAVPETYRIQNRSYTHSLFDAEPIRPELFGVLVTRAEFRVDVVPRSWVRGTRLLDPPPSHITNYLEVDAIEFVDALSVDSVTFLPDE